MSNLWPLLGIVVITLGMLLRVNTLLVVLTAGFVTGILADMPLMEILSKLGASFTKNRYMSIFILVLPMIGVLERFGLKQRAADIMASFKGASAGKIILLYMVFRKLTSAFGIHLSGHPAMIRPLVAPMAEAAAAKNREPLSEKEVQTVRALAAAGENFANFFSQLIFIGSGGLLLIKGVFDENAFPLQLSRMFPWAIPTAFFSLLVFALYLKFFDARLRKQTAPKEKIIMNEDKGSKTC